MDYPKRLIVAKGNSGRMMYHMEINRLSKELSTTSFTGAASSGSIFEPTLKASPTVFCAYSCVFDTLLK